MAVGSLYRRTIRALVTPRRLVPVTAVVATLAVTEAVYTRNVAYMSVDLTLCLAFWLLGPASWRWLCSTQWDRDEHRIVIGYVIYLATSLAIIVTIGTLGPYLAGLRWTLLTELSTLGVVFVLYVVGGWGLGRDIELEEGLHEEQRRAQRLALEAERAQLLALRAHLDPHFLFNTLNAIAEWCREDPEVAESATLRLADMLRTVLEGVKIEEWPLEKELALIDDLFALYRVRDPDRYRFVVHSTEPPPEVPVPPMILLPLVENAIKHGPSSGHDGEVVISIKTIDDGDLRVELRNPGRFEGRRKGGEGIAMVERRLALAYDGEARLDHLADGEETVTTLTVPHARAGTEGAT